MSAIKKTLLISLFKYEFGLINYTISDLINHMMNVYVMERFKSTDYDCHILKSQAESEKRIKAKDAVQQIFIKNAKRKKPTVSNVYFLLMKSKFDLSDDKIALVSIINQIQKSRIKSIYAYKYAHRIERINLDFDMIEQDTGGQSHVEVASVQSNELQNKIDMFKQFRINFPLESSRKTDVERDEWIRYMHAMYMYSGKNGGRISRVLFDFAYGFHPVRNENWVKNKQHGLPTFLFKYKDQMEQMIKEVIEWSPNSFTISDRMQYLSSHGIEMTQPMLDSYLGLVRLDINAWWNNSDRLEIFNETASNIINKIVKKSSAYIKHRQYIESCTESFQDVVRPCRIAFDLTPQSVLDQSLKENNCDDSSDVQVVSEQVSARLCENSQNINQNSVEDSKTKDDNIEKGIFRHEDLFKFDDVEIPDYCQYQKPRNFNNFRFVFTFEDSEESNNESPDNSTLSYTIIDQFPENKGNKKNYVPLRKTVNSKRVKVEQEKNKFANVSTVSDKWLSFENSRVHNTSELFEKSQFMEEDGVDKKNQELYLPIKLEKSLFKIDNSSVIDRLGSAFENLSINRAIENKDVNFLIENETELKSVCSSEHDDILANDETCHFFDNDIHDFDQNNSLTNISEQSQNNNRIKKFKANSTDEAVDRIFSKYRFKMFKLYEARKNLFGGKDGVTQEKWKEIVDKMTSENSWSIIELEERTFYKFNYKSSQTGKFVSFNCIFDSIRSSILKSPKLRESQNTLRRNIAFKNRAPTEIWKLYLEDLVLDNFLKKIIIDEYTYYSLNQ